MKPSYILILLLTLKTTQQQVVGPLMESFKKPHDFSIQQGSFDDSLSKSLFFYSLVSKCPLQNILDWSCGYFCNLHPGMQEVQVFSNSTNHGQAFCGYNEKEDNLVFSFRSSQDTKNFLQDLKAYKSYTKNLCPNCQVHTGFLQTYQDVSEGMIKCASNLIGKYPSAKVTMVGHSLGGALATLFAIDLQILGYKMTNLFTYGCPRVGNYEFYEYFQNNVKVTNRYRITHNQDIVPHSPANAQGYFHITQEVWYNKDFSKYIICDEQNSEDSKGANSQWAVSINDHTTYYNNNLDCGDQLYNILSQMQ